MPDPLQLFPFTISLVLALLRQFKGEDSVSELLYDLAELSGKELSDRLKKVAEKSALARQVLGVEPAVQRCLEERLAEEPELRGAVQSLPLTNLPSLQVSILSLATELSEAPLHATLDRLLEKDWPDLSARQRRRISDLYMDCLRRALLSIPVYGEKVIGLAVLRVDATTQRIEAKAELQLDELDRLRRKVDQLFSPISPVNSDRYRSFRELYLGSANQPAPPFGGRREALGELSNWLFAENQPPYALLVAPAGRGKSHLLVRWISELLEQSEVSVVFVPISLRAGTATKPMVFACLAAQLSEKIEAEEWANLFNASDIHLKGLCEHYLRTPAKNGRPLLVVIDGLDEGINLGIDPLFFPAQPPPGLRILVSARSVEAETSDWFWRNQLGWQSSTLAASLGLKRLDRAGIGEVLQSLGNPTAGLSGQVDVLQKLQDITGGDPLLVRLFVELIQDRLAQQGSLAPADILDLQPDLKGYFDAWRFDQQKQWDEQPGIDFTFQINQIYSFLYTISCSQGAITIEDLRSVAPPNSRLGETAVLEKSLQSTRRFVIGDGQNEGFRFSHPRLKDYFREELIRQGDVQEWDERYLRYCLSWLEKIKNKEVSPDNVPDYVIEHLRDHLDSAQTQPETYFSLICEPWMRVWYAHEGSYSGFLSDIQAAWERADHLVQENLEESDPSDRLEGLIIGIKAALIQSSIASLSSNYSPELLSLALQRRKLSATQVLVILSQIPDGKSIASLLSAVVEYFSGEDIERGYSIAMAIRNEYYRSEALVALAPYLPVVQNEQALEAALQAALAIEDDDFRFRALAALAHHLPADQLEATLQATLAICDNSEALAALAPHLSADQLASALQIALVITNEYYRSRALTTLAPHLPIEQKEQALEVALQAALEIGYEYLRSKALSALIPHVSADQADTVLRAALAIGDEYYRSQTLAAILQYLSDEQREDALEAAQQAALAVGHESLRSLALATLAPNLPDDQLETALRSALIITDKYYRLIALTILAPYLPALHREQALEAALQAASLIGDHSSRLESLSALVPHLSAGRKERVSEAILQAALIIPDEYHRSKVLVSITPYLPTRQKERALEATLQAALIISDEYHRSKGLISIIPYLPIGQKKQALEAAIQAILEIEHDPLLWKDLIGFAPYMCKDQLKAVLQGALVIEHLFERTNSLAALVPYLPVDQKEQVVKEVLQAALAIGNEEFRLKTLVALAPYLPVEQKEQIIKEGLQEATMIRNEDFSFGALAILAPHLSADQLEVALQVALAIDEKAVRSLALTALVPYLPVGQKEHVLEVAKQAALEFGDKYYRVDALTALVPLLPAGQKEQVLDEALKVSKQFWEDSIRSEILATLAPYMPTDRLEAALQAALTFWDQSSRAEALEALAPYLAVRSPRQPNAATLAWLSSLHTLARYPRPEILYDLKSLYPYLFSLVPERDNNKLAAGLYDAIQEISSWWP